MTTIDKNAAALAALAVFIFAASSPGDASNTNREQAKANFLQADLNRDQHLDYGEFTTFINLNAQHRIGKAAQIKRFGAHARAFGRLDRDKDGRISPQELAAAAGR